MNFNYLTQNENFKSLEVFDKIAIVASFYYLCFLLIWLTASKFAVTTPPGRLYFFMILVFYLIVKCARLTEDSYFKQAPPCEFEELENARQTVKGAPDRPASLV